MALLDGKVVLVTGAGRGLGRSQALELARHGATVVVNDLGVTLAGDPDDGPSVARAVADEIEAAGGAAMADETSVADWDGIESLVARVVERHGHLDAVVNNAGFLRSQPLTSMTEAEFDDVLEVHLKGTFTVTRHACAHWRARAEAGERVSARVVNTTSGAGLWGSPGQLNYSTAKSAIAGLTVVAALEMAEYGVTVNAISPIASTRMTTGTYIVGGGDAGSGWDRLDPANASSVVSWLVSDDSGWLSGAILRIEGDTVSRVDGYHVNGSYRSRGGAGVTVEELPQAVRQLFGALPKGLADQGR